MEVLVLPRNISLADTVVMIVLNVFRSCYLNRWLSSGHDPLCSGWLLALNYVHVLVLVCSNVRRLFERNVSGMPLLLAPPLTNTHSQWVNIL